MKEKLTLFIIGNLAATLLACFAFGLAINNKDGWGWFLFASIATITGPSITKDD